MTHRFEPGDGITLIGVDFSDEGVALQGETTVKGGTEQAEKYLPAFERDLRENYRDLFPVPEPEIEPEGEMMI